MYYILFYDVVEEVFAKRGEYRAEHLALAYAAHERGELVMGGAVADPVDGGVLVFKGDSPAVAERFAESDPYVKYGLVARWHVRRWGVTVGG